MVKCEKLMLLVVIIHMYVTVKKRRKKRKNYTETVKKTRYKIIFNLLWSAANPIVHGFCRLWLSKNVTKKKNFVKLQYHNINVEKNQKQHQRQWIRFFSMKLFHFQIHLFQWCVTRETFFFYLSLSFSFLR